MKFIGPLPSLACVGLGLGASFVGLLLNAFLQGAIISVIQMKVALNRNSETLPIWRDVPIEIYTRFYVFNYTNVEDFLANWTSGVKPKVEQLGPYTFRQYRQKTLLKFDDDDDTIDYTETKHYYFISEKSNGLESDVVRIPNIPLMAIIELAPDEEKPALRAAIQMTNTTTFIETTIGQLLFQGYKDNLVELIQDLSGVEILPDAMFGLFYGKNGSDDGLVKVKRGNDDNKEIGKIVEWKNMTTLPYWNGMPCNQMQATDGSLFHVNVEKDEILVIFNFDLTMSLYFRFVREIDYHGITAYRFSADLSLLADINMNPDNRCYCLTNDDKCSDSGVMSLAPAKEGAPVYISFPHFLMANHKTRFAIDGLDPDPNLHGLYLDIHPVAGAPMRIAARLQMNVGMKASEGIESVENLPKIILPILWIEESAELTEELRSMLKFKMGMAMFTVDALPSFVIFIGLTLVLLGSSMSLFLLFQMKQSRVLPLMVGEDKFVKPKTCGYFDGLKNSIQ